MNTPLERIRGLFAGARHRILIISAYVGSETLDSLLEAASSAATNREVVANWSTKDVSSGASDWRAWDVVKAHGASMYACSGLHAKLYVADEVALVGSANATTPGLHGGERANLELIVSVSAREPEVTRLIRKVNQTKIAAPPYGPDILPAENEEKLRSGEESIPLWIPRSDPESFLRACSGQVRPSVEIKEDRKALRLDAETTCRRSVIREAAQNQTVFRVVRHAFNGRIAPVMVQSEIRELLFQEVGHGMGRLSDDQLDRLTRWLGRFGRNTILNPSSPYTEGRVSLNFGEFVASDPDIIN